MWIHRARRAATVVLFGLFALDCGNTKPSNAPSSARSSLAKAENTSPTRASEAQATSDEIPVSADDAVWGDANAPVTLVEFSDLQCPFCGRVQPTVNELQGLYGPNKLRVVFKHNPLSFHENALPGAKYAQAVYRNGGSRAFFAFLDLAFGEQGRLGDAALRDWGRRVGLDPDAVAAGAELPDVAAKIARDIELADKLGATGTPAFRINGIVLVGAQPLDAFTTLIDAELVASAALSSQGTAPAAVYAARVRVNYEPPEPEPDDEPDVDLNVWKMPVAGVPIIGAKDALVTIVEFYDYQCPFCRRAEQTLNELSKLYPKDVRVALRQNPLPFHPRALPAANLALEARAERGDAGFLAAHQRLFADTTTSLEDDELLRIASELKLDTKRVRKAITFNTHAAEIEADADVADAFQAHGTPHFFVNGVRLSGAQPLENFVKLVEAQLKVAKALVASGTPPRAVYAEILAHAKEPAPPETKPAPAVTALNPSRGPLTAPVVIHEFADFQCPFCGRVEPTLGELERAFPNQIRFVWHDLPLKFHEHAMAAAVFAREARAEKGDAAFWKLHDAMFADQGSDTALTPAAFERYAARFGLDPASVSAAQSDGRFDAALAEDRELSRGLHIDGTPAFLINGYYLSGARPLAAFKRLVRRALKDHAAGPKPTLVKVP